MDFVFHTLDGSPDITFVQTSLLELGPHVGQLLFRLLVVEENIEVTLPSPFCICADNPFRNVRPTACFTICLTHSS